MAPPDGRGQEMTSRLLKSMWSLQAGVEGTLSKEKFTYIIGDCGMEKIE